MSTEKIAIVTGAAQGVGLVTATTLAQRGLRTVLTDIQGLDGVLEKLRGQGAKVEGHVGDVSSEEFVRDLAQRVERNYGGAAALVNNAGISMICPAEQTTAEQWQKVMNVNLLGPFLLSRYVGAQMLARGSGSIINVASVAG